MQHLIIAAVEQSMFWQEPSCLQTVIAAHFYGIAVSSIMFSFTVFLARA